MDNAANSVAPANVVVVVAHRRREELEETRALLEGTVSPIRVVVRDVLAQHPLQVLAQEDQDPVETLAPDAADQRSVYALESAVTALDAACEERVVRVTDPFHPWGAEDLVRGPRLIRGRPQKIPVYGFALTAWCT